MTGRPKAEVDSSDRKEILKLAIRELKEETGEKPATRLADDRVVERAGELRHRKAGEYRPQVRILRLCGGRQRCHEHSG